MTCVFPRALTFVFAVPTHSLWPFFFCDMPCTRTRMFFLLAPAVVALISIVVIRRARNPASKTAKPASNMVCSLSLPPAYRPLFLTCLMSSVSHLLIALCLSPAFCLLFSLAYRTLSLACFLFLFLFLTCLRLSVPRLLTVFCFLSLSVPATR
jgi:hypothetical protein